jgi:lipopolysaccharide transport system ATP-binding protein
MTDEVLVRVDGVSKKFCRSLKKSLWYGARDVLSELNPFARAKGGKPLGNGHGAADTELRPDLSPTAAASKCAAVSAP